MNSIKASYSRKGYPYHNAWIESFHSTLKREQLYRLILMSVDDACFDYLDGFYNTIRIHESLGYKTPNELEEFKGGEIKKLETEFKNGIICYNGEVKEFAI